MWHFCLLPAIGAQHWQSLFGIIGIAVAIPCKRSDEWGNIGVVNPSVKSFCSGSNGENWYITIGVIAGGPAQVCIVVQNFLGEVSKGIFLGIHAFSTLVGAFDQCFVGQ